MQLGYRRLAGGCSEQQAEDRKEIPLSADDLFCLDDDAGQTSWVPESEPLASHEAGSVEDDDIEYGDPEEGQEHPVNAGTIDEHHSPFNDPIAEDQKHADRSNFPSR